MVNFSDTICAPATLAGTGAISIVRISGPDAFKAADSIVVCRGGTLATAPSHTIHHCTVRDGSGTLDDAVAAVFRAPRSYTGEDSVELYCHASTFIVSRLLELLQDAGCRMARPGEFTQRAFLAGKMDLSQAEAVADVIGASTAVEHRVAMNQMRGGYSAELRSLRDRLLELSALLELELDFSEEEVEFADRAKLRGLCSQAEGHCRRLADSFRLGNALKNGVPVAIVGAPNSGKSTLLNALVGEERAIVTDIPGTTRDTIEESCVLDGVRFRFIDTAGIRESADLVEKMGIERARAAMGKADIVIGVVDGTLPHWRDEASELASRVADWQKFILAVNKRDLAGAGADYGPESGSGQEDGFGAGSGLVAGYGPGASPGTVTVAISAKTGTGLDELRAAIAGSISAHGEGDTLVTNARHAAALAEASKSLRRVLANLDGGIPGDLLAEDLRDAIRDLSGIIGEDITADEVLGEIFGKFCIGK